MDKIDDASLKDGSFNDIEAWRKAASAHIHDMLGPLHGVELATEQLQHEIKNQNRGSRQDYAEASCRSKGYIDSIYCWTWQMRFELEIYRISVSSNSHLIRTPHSPFSLSAVLFSSIRFIEIDLLNHRFSKDRIKIHGCQNFPRLWIDSNLFSVAVACLLSNSIESAYSDPELFSVEIICEEQDDDFVIRVQDWGIPIDKTIKEYFSSPGSCNEIIGMSRYMRALCLARRVVVAHRGDFQIINDGTPTEIGIRLPRALALKSPQVET